MTAGLVLSNASKSAITLGDHRGGPGSESGERSAAKHVRGASATQDSSRVGREHCATNLLISASNVEVSKDILVRRCGSPGLPVCGARDRRLPVLLILEMGMPKLASFPLA